MTRRTYSSGLSAGVKIGGDLVLLRMYVFKTIDREWQTLSLIYYF